MTKFFTMKTRAVILFFALFLISGFVQNVQGQASASVSYTIVVTEDMLAGNQNDCGFDQESRIMENTIDAPQSSVSVKLQDAANRGHEIQTFEAELSPEQSPAISGMLEKSFVPGSTEEYTADIQTEKFDREAGDYMVVMEFN